MFRTALYFVAIAALALTGCADATKKKAPPEPKPSISFNEGVSQLHELNETVKTAFESGDPHSCDGALHEILDIVTVLPDVAMEEGALGAEGVATVKTASKNLLDQCVKIHEGFHHDGPKHDEAGESEGNVYDSVASEITSSLSALKDLTTQ